MIRQNKGTQPYLSAIDTYKKRREKIKEEMMNKYQWSGGNSRFTSTPPEYLEKVKVINARLDTFKKQIKRIQKKEKEIRRVADKVVDFLGEEIRYTQASYVCGNTIGTENQRLGRNILSKYLMERNINGVLIEKYLDPTFKYDVRVSQLRRRFTRSFQNNQRNREAYHSFVKFIEERE